MPQHAQHIRIIGGGFCGMSVSIALRGQGAATA